VPLGDAREAWLSVDGEPERDFAAHEAQQMVVRVAVPPGSPAGKYAFRLDAVSVADPDDDYTPGPVVAFEVQPAAPPPAKFPWWIVPAGALALLLAAGLAWYFLRPRGATPAETPVEAAFEAPAEATWTNRKVRFTNKTTGKAKGYTWFFGDRSSSQDADPEHEYKEPGTYLVTLVADGPGEASKRTVQQTVRIVPDNAWLLLGKWEATRDAQNKRPIGLFLEFSNDGKWKTTRRAGGAPEDGYGTYKVEGQFLRLTGKIGTGSKEEPFEIAKISDKDLVLIRTLEILMFKRATQAADKKDKPDYARLLVGTWEVDTQLPKSVARSIYEFNKDGSMKVTTASYKGEKDELTGVYKLEGNKLYYTLKLPGGREEKESMNIYDISEGELVLDTGSGEGVALLRMK
jgi:uncharacterized protein (TIGR03066 family)